MSEISILVLSYKSVIDLCVSQFLAKCESWLCSDSFNNCKRYILHIVSQNITGDYGFASEALKTDNPCIVLIVSKCEILTFLSWPQHDDCGGLTLNIETCGESSIETWDLCQYSEPTFTWTRSLEDNTHDEDLATAILLANSLIAMIECQELCLFGEKH